MVVAAVILVAVALMTMQRTRSKGVLPPLTALISRVRMTILLKGWPRNPCGDETELPMVGVVAEMGEGGGGRGGRCWCCR